ncbi:MAG: CSLREA domain-containing protein, partial [Chloroflexi bacterium]|nr:CSLREA domain-containing protein [Chloroflexota bacterium]
MRTFLSLPFAQSKRWSVLVYLVITAVIILSLFTSLTNNSLQAAGPYTVNTTSDTVDVNPGDGTCADSGGLCSLRAAIQEANAFPGDDLITLSAATYTLSIGGTGEDAGATGDLDIDSADTLTLIGAGEDATFISAAGIDRVVHLIQGSLEISDLSITGGDITGDGGGIRLESSTTLTLTGTVVDSNSASSNGGGIYTQGNMTIINSVISGNGAGAGGGGIYNAGAATILSSNIDNNNAPDSGGGIYNLNGQTITITNSTLGDNATESGAVFNNDGTSTINHSTIAQSGGLGDGLVNDGVLNMTHTIVAGTISDSDCINGGTFNDNGYNLIEDGSCITAVTSLSGDPSLDTDYSDNGGPMGTFALIAPSIAIDAGDPSIAAPPTHDQRGNGFPRIIDGGSGSIIDIGAFEYDEGQGSSPFVVNALDNDAPADPLHALGDPADSVAVACSVAHCTLQEAIMTANALAGSDSIHFDISGAGPHIFQPTSQLATLTERAIIDGSTDPDGAIILDGSLAGSEADGLTLNDTNFTITDLEITNFDGDGLVVLSGSSNIFYDNSIHGNNGLGIDLNNDGVTPNDYLDGDSGPNELQNAPVLQRVIISGTETIVQGFLLGKPNDDHEIILYSNTQCDDSFFGEGEQLIGSTTAATNGSGYATFLTTLPVALPSGTGVTAVVGFDMNAEHGTSEFSRCLVAGPNNDTWPNAFEVPLIPSVSGDRAEGSTSQYLSRPSQSSWYRFPVAPNSAVIVDMVNLPANYDLVLFRDIAQTYEALTTPENLDDLVEINAEFAPEMFTPEMFTPEMFTPEMFTPEMFTPEMFTPEMFTPEMFTPEMFTPEMFTPEMFTPEMFTPEMFTPEMFT